MLSSTWALNYIKVRLHCILVTFNITLCTNELQNWFRVTTTTTHWSVWKPMNKVIYTPRCQKGTVPKGDKFGFSGKIGLGGVPKGDTKNPFYEKKVSTLFVLKLCELWELHSVETKKQQQIQKRKTNSIIRILTAVKSWINMNNNN